MIIFQANGRFMSEQVNFTCSVDENRIIITSDADNVFYLAQAVSSGLGAEEFTPANVRQVLGSRVFDRGCTPEITGWLKLVV